MSQESTPESKGRKLRKGEDVNDLVFLGWDEPGNRNNGVEGGLLNVRLSKRAANMFPPDPSQPSTAPGPTPASGSSDPTGETESAGS
jgi:hypothetical protein